MERSQLDAQTVDVDAPQIVDVDLDVDEGDNEKVADNKGGGHRVSWMNGELVKRFTWMWTEDSCLHVLVVIDYFTITDFVF
ncbi:unnamed protein product [Lactuca virosa]|uniref:Uncharacterized protein n=1 Tax=Lactuca virosa TaxID=75947 RepID=A0AAU9PTW8_9ASTR|nr:unnamed protein product [Lactuca virosa]